MGNVLAASLRVIQAELATSQAGQSAALSASLRTIEHVKDVLIAKKSHFDPTYANDLVGVASQDLLGSTVSSTKAPSMVTAMSNVSLMDQTSPTLPSTATMPPLPKPAFTYPAAPPRTPSAQHTSPEQPSMPREHALPSAPAPTHHQYTHAHSGTNGCGSDSTFPDLGDWQTDSNSSSHPLSIQSAFPRYPPTSRILRAQDPGRQPLSHGTAPSKSAIQQHRRSQSRQEVNAVDPLGALF